jgi:hypothetical protein
VLLKGDVLGIRVDGADWVMTRAPASVVPETVIGRPAAHAPLQAAVTLLLSGSDAVTSDVTALNSFVVRELSPPAGLGIW